MLYAKHKKDREVVSVLNDVDFCIELMESDRINVAYSRSEKLHIASLSPGNTRT